jgi:hypothetical protein
LYLAPGQITGTLAPKLQFLTAACSEVRFDVGANLLGDSRMATYHGVYLISVIAIFTRWVNPLTRTHTFRLPSTVMCLCRFLCLQILLPTHESLIMIEGSIHFLVKIFPMMEFMFSSGSQWRIVSSAFPTCTFYEVVGLSSLNPTRHPLVKTLAICRLSESWSSAFLLSPLKFGSTKHVLSL